MGCGLMTTTVGADIESQISCTCTSAPPRLVWACFRWCCLWSSAGKTSRTPLDTCARTRQTEFPTGSQKPEPLCVCWRVLTSRVHTRRAARPLRRTVRTGKTSFCQDITVFTGHPLGRSGDPFEIRHEVYAHSSGGRRLNQRRRVTTGDWRRRGEAAAMGEVRLSG